MMQIVQMAVFMRGVMASRDVGVKPATRILKFTAIQAPNKIIITNI